MHVCRHLIDGHSLQLARDTMLRFLFYCASWWFFCAKHYCENIFAMTLATFTNIDESGILEFYDAHESRTSSNLLSSSMRWTPRNKCSFSPHTSKTQAMVIPLPNVKNMWKNLQYLGISVSCNIRYDGSMTQQPMSTPKITTRNSVRSRSAQMQLCRLQQAGRSQNSTRWHVAFGNNVLMLCNKKLCMQAWFVVQFSRLGAQGPKLMARGSWLLTVRGSWFLKVRGSWLLMSHWFMACAFSRHMAPVSRLVDCSDFCDPSEAQRPQLFTMVCRFQ